MKWIAVLSLIVLLTQTWGCADKCNFQERCVDGGIETCAIVKQTNKFFFTKKKVISTRACPEVNPVCATFTFASAACVRSLTPCDDSFEASCIEGASEFGEEGDFLVSCPESISPFISERLPVAQRCNSSFNPFSIAGVLLGSDCAEGNQGEPVCTTLDTCEDHLQCLAICEGAEDAEEPACEADCVHHVSPDSFDLAQEATGCLEECGDSESCVLIQCASELDACLDDDTD